MKSLMEFFDLNRFLEGKSLVAAAQPTEWKSKDGSTVLGTTLKVEVDADETVYSRPEASNEGEQFSVKSSKPITSYAWVKRHEPVEIADWTTATVYGDFNNGLSVRGDLAQKKASKE